jgi:cytochrome d ubiquinol oxidase subunit II
MEIDAMAETLTVIWAGLIAFTVLAYVLMDGFDLGIGILFIAEHEPEDRDVMVNTIAPVWDGNETWLVLGGGALFAVFPPAYATIMSALYPTITAMLLALVFRGVAFEFRFRAISSLGKRGWDLAFCAGSLAAALCQGMTLGGLLQGVHVVDRRYAGGWWDWLNGFTILCGLAVATGYALLGACWLIWRTEGELQSRTRRSARSLAAAVLGLIVVVSLWTPSLHVSLDQRWFRWPTILLTAPAPILVVALAWGFWSSLSRKHELTPLLCAYGWFIVCYAGLTISVFPLIVPPSITIWQAAAAPSSQLFLLVGAVILIPTILAYTSYAYWVFRGKVKAGAHYH